MSQATVTSMAASELAARILAEIKKRGDLPVVIVDSHGNTCELGQIEFLRYAHPTLVIHTQP